MQGFTPISLPLRELRDDDNITKHLIDLVSDFTGEVDIQSLEDALNAANFSTDYAGLHPPFNFKRPMPGDTVYQLYISTAADNHTKILVKHVYIPGGMRPVLFKEYI